MAIDYAQGLSDNPIIQVVHATTTSQSSTSSSSFQNGLGLDITPHNSSNKIIVMGTGQLSMGGGSTMGGIIRIVRQVSGQSDVNVSGDGNYGHGFCGATNYDMDIVPSNGFIYVDAPGTTSMVTYRQQFRTEHHTVHYNHKQYAGRPGKASFVLIEVVA